MKCHLILLLVTMCVTSAQRPDMTNSTKRVGFIRFRNASQVLPFGRGSRGQSLPILRFRSRVLSRPNARYLIPWPIDFRTRNPRTKRPTSRPMTPAVKRGTSSLRAINIGSPRNFRRTRFFAVPLRSRSFRGNYRMPASRLSMTRKGWSRRITVPQKFFPRDTGKRIVTIPIQFHPTKDNVSDIRSSLGDKANSKRLNESQRGSIPGRSGFHSPVRAKLSRRGDPRALSATRSFFSYPRATNVGFGLRNTNSRQINSQFGSRIPHGTYPLRPRMILSSRTMSSNRIPNPYSRPFFRSRFRSFSVRNPAIPGFRSFDRRISGGWSDASPVHTASKSTPFIDNKSGIRVGVVGVPRNNITQLTATFMEYSPEETSQSGQNSTKVDAMSSLKPFIADQFGGKLGSVDINDSGNVSSFAESSYVSSAADNTTVENQTLVTLVPIGLSNADGAPSNIDFERPNADAPEPDNQNLVGVGGPTQLNVRKLPWLTKIVNTREGLEEALEEGGLASRLQRSGPHTYADLMAALRKGSHFNDEVVADMQNEGQWDQILSAAGIGPNDRDEQGDKLGWLTEIVNRGEGLEEAMDDDGLAIRLHQTGPHTYDEFMAALRKGSHFSDDVVADMKSDGEWEQFLRTAGIYTIDTHRQDRMPENENTATNMEVKNDQVDVQVGRTRHHNLAQGQQMARPGSAAAVDQTSNYAPPLVNQNEANTNSSKTGAGGSSGTVSQSEDLLQGVQFKSVLTNEENPNIPEKVAGTNGKNTSRDPASEETRDTPENAAGTDGKKHNPVN